MKLLRVINNGRRGFIHQSYLLYLNEMGKTKRYSVVGRREINTFTDLNGYVAGVIAIITNSAEEVLISKEFRLGVNRWLYGFPCGTLEKEETPSQCAIRETEEETGIKDIHIDHVTKPEYMNPTLSNERLVIVYGHVDGSPIPRKSDNPNEEIDSFLFPKRKLAEFVGDHEKDISLIHRLIMENSKV